jgi:hypothetical protein
VTSVAQRVMCTAQEVASDIMAQVAQSIKL